MAGINMLNNTDHHHHLYGGPPPPPPMGPRISFSNDFVLDPPPPPAVSRVAADSDFEFSVGSHQMMDAGQLFSKGRILPLKNNHHSKWREILGLKKNRCCSGSKKGDQSGDGPPVAATVQIKKATQELRVNGGM